MKEQFSYLTREEGEGWEGKGGGGAYFGIKHSMAVIEKLLELDRKLSPPNIDWRHWIPPISKLANRVKFIKFAPLIFVYF